MRLWLDVLRISILKSTSKLEHVAWQFHNGLRGKRILIVLENIDDPEAVQLLNPGTANCVLLVTTHQEDIAQRLLSNHALLIELTTLPHPANQTIARLSYK